MRIRSRLATKLAAVLFARLVRLLFRTLRLDFRRTATVTNPFVSAQPERFIYSVWHDSLLIAAFAGRHTQGTALTSRHRDGSFVADGLKAIGIPVVRGSTGQGGASAVRELIRSTQGRYLVITPDGPRGPRRQMSRGAVFLASRTGRAIVPTAFSCAKSWRIKGNWTDLVIPKPFSKVFLLPGDPIQVPPGLTRKDLNDYVDLVQDKMDRLNDEADQIAAGK